MKKILITWSVAFVVAIIAIFVALIIFHPPKPTLIDLTQDEIRMRFYEAGEPILLVVSQELLLSDSLLTSCYRKRKFKPLWINKKGLIQLTDSLINTVKHADFEGLLPHEYHAPILDSLLKVVRMLQEEEEPYNLKELVDMEFLLSDAFLSFSIHLLAGRVDQHSIDPEWLTARPEEDVNEIMYKAVHDKKIKHFFAQMLPPLQCYSELRNEFKRYETIALKGGWPIVPSGTSLKKGDRGFRIAALKARFLESNDLSEDEIGIKTLFDDKLEKVVQDFQERHGMIADGVIGPGTLAFLNRPALYYMQKIAVNMERWRWLPRNLGERYLLVNVAAFTMDVFENGESIFTMPVVVGKDARRTPVFSGKMSYLVLNPYWHVPKTIAKEDILPAVRDDIEYLSSRDIRVIRNWGDTTYIDPSAIDWQEIDAEQIPYKFRQLPGPQNALGRIKFMFPNKYDIYLHDTPYQSFFEKTRRAFSSGCIRVSDPLSLADYLLVENEKWSIETISAALDSLENFSIRLPEKIPVHIFYCTAYTQEDGKINFREDIYNRDAAVIKALRIEKVLQD